MSRFSSNNGRQTITFVGSKLIFLHVFHNIFLSCFTTQKFGHSSVSFYSMPVQIEDTVHVHVVCALCPHVVCTLSAHSLQETGELFLRGHVD